MDQAVRNKLRNVVTQCRKSLEDATAKALQGRFGIYAACKKGEVQIDDESRLGHLTDEDRACRQDLIEHLEHIQALGSKPSEALDQLIREIAFTHLNRLCAYKMMEARGLIREAVSRGVKSQGFIFYLADHPEDEKLHNSGKQEVAYRNFLDWLGGTLSEEIGVLFNPNDPANRIYPPQRVLDEILGLINSGELKDNWAEDETIGWIYQYFTPKEVRVKARKDSPAPRNSYELAFRNQFYTPRYVVEFLSDNALGRLWFEMRKGETALKDLCHYLVRRPEEVFLADGEELPTMAGVILKDLASAELQRQPAYVSHRPKKDPREIKILDPACGSGHFLLYCFDLFHTIYQEAYGDPDLGAELKKDYPTLDALHRAMPGLILKYNLHGIDIDLRATQIAALALWLRCQRVYQKLGLKNGERPKITRANIVCAEPMPGEADLLKEFTASLRPKVLGQLVQAVFDRMNLAGEAGSLLKIENEIEEAVRKAKADYIEWKKHEDKARGQLFPELLQCELPNLLDFADLTDKAFLDRAEEEIVTALRQYAEKASNGRAFRRQLFAEDAARGFAFIEASRRKYDVVLMNPPFGDPTPSMKAYLAKFYADTKTNLYTTFVERSFDYCPKGFVSLISPRTFVVYRDFEKYRRELLLSRLSKIMAFADLGWEVLDGAQVETAAFTIQRGETGLSGDDPIIGPFYRLLGQQPQDRGDVLLTMCGSLFNSEEIYLIHRDQLEMLPGAPLAYWASRRMVDLFSQSRTFEPDEAICCRGAAAHVFFFRLAWEVPLELSTKDRWIRLAHGGEYSPFFRENSIVIDWEDNGKAIKEYIVEKYPYLKGSFGWAIQNEDMYGRVGITSSKRNERFNAQLMPAGHIFSNEGQGFIPHEVENTWFALGYLNSSLVSYFLSLTSGLQKTWVYIRPIPIVDVSVQTRRLVETCAKEIYSTKRMWMTGSEESAFFLCPWILNKRVLESIEEGSQELISKHRNDSQEINRKRDAISRAIVEGAGLDPSDESEIAKDFERHPKDVAFSAWRGLESVDNVIDVAKRLLSYSVGCVFGRWDVRIATGERQPPVLPDPFEHLPLCPPGMLQGKDSIPAKREDMPPEYPLLIDWDGIVADDPEHEDDVLRRVQDVLEVICEGQAEPVEKEACEILNAKDLRDYFRKPGKGGFWEDHVKQYSKNRRKAPIYWYLRSVKGKYGLWLYYPRLDKDILFKALLNYVEPKIRLEEDRLNILRSRKEAAGSAGREAKRIEKEMDRLEQFVSELHDFKDKLRRAADLHLILDLNDGVALNIAPLWELVPWKEAKKYWEELSEGKHQWSSISNQLRNKELVKS